MIISITNTSDVEICSANAKGEWIRIKGTAVMDDSEEALAQAIEMYPFLTTIYNEKTGHTFGLCYLDNIDAEIAATDGRYEKL